MLLNLYSNFVWFYEWNEQHTIQQNDTGFSFNYYNSIMCYRKKFLTEPSLLTKKIAYNNIFETTPRIWYSVKEEIGGYSKNYVYGR